MMKRFVAVLLVLLMLTGSASAAWYQNAWGWRWTDSNGRFVTMCWQKIKNVWYAFGPDGYMLVGFYEIDGTPYYFDASGAMATGWKLIGGFWYYFRSNGAMARNCWVGNYYLGSDGIMLTNTITPDGYRVGPNGAWIP